jgi:hypothetical protein
MIPMGTGDKNCCVSVDHQWSNSPRVSRPLSQSVLWYGDGMVLWYAKDRALTFSKCTSMKNEVNLPLHVIN